MHSKSEQDATGCQRVLILEIHIQGPFGGSLVFSGDPNPAPEDTGGRRSRGPSPARSPLSRTAPGRLEQLDQDDEEDTTHLKKVHLVCRLLFFAESPLLSLLHGFVAVSVQ